MSSGFAVNNETGFWRSLKLHPGILQREQAARCSELRCRQNTIVRRAAKFVVAFFEPEQSHQSQPSVLALQLGQALCLPCSNLFSVGCVVDVRLWLFARARAEKRDDQ